VALRPEVDEIWVTDPPGCWEALGFTVLDDVVALDGVRVRLGAGGARGEAGSAAAGAVGRGEAGSAAASGVAGRGPGGIAGWSLRGLPAGADLDGLPSAGSDAPAPEPVAEQVAHPNGAVTVDHVVAFTPDFDRTVSALRAAGLDYRRTREAGTGMRQAFFVVGPCLLELGGPAGEQGPARFWGLTLVVEDIDATAELLGDRLGRIKDAVQPGRRIATVRESAGLGVPLAFMTPRR
jgi:hypothetical protein